MADLRLGDNDAQKIWGGVAQPQAPAGTYVADLQRQLQELGFRVARTTGDDADAPGVFGFWTAMAVREFQAYARLPTVAVEGTPAADPFAYTSHDKAAAEIYAAAFPISGVANAETTRLLTLWKQNRWRCPVVVCGFSKTPGITNRTFTDPAAARKLATVQNAWSRYDHATSAAVYCSMDYGDMIGGQPAVEIIGRAHAKTSTGSSGIGGLVVDGRLSDPAAKITPASLVGAAPYSEATKATYRVIISVAHFEVSERFDAINGWDSQVLSFGPFQFVITALGKKDPTAGSKRAPTTGELPAFIAMLQAGSASQQRAYADSFGVLGMSSDTAWANIQPNISQETLLAKLTLQGPNGPGPMVNEADFNPWPELAGAKEPVRQWHLFRRAVVTARRSTEIQLAFWRFCRLRIRNLLATPWGDMTGYNWPAATTLGDVLRSELATAVMLRLHVKSPGVFAAADTHGVVAVREWLKQVIRDWTFAGKTNPPAQWQLPATTGEEPLVSALADRLAQGPVAPAKGQAQIFVPSLTRATLRECRDIIAGKVQTPFQALRRDRSFTLDPTGL